MEKPVLMRTLSSEGKQSAETLDEAGIDYTEVFSDDYFKPSLIVPNASYPYKGLGAIKGYIRYQKQKKELQNQSIH